MRSAIVAVAIALGAAACAAPVYVCQAATARDGTMLMVCAPWDESRAPATGR